MEGYIYRVLVAIAFVAAANAATDKIFCYYGSWAHYHKNEGKVSAEDLNPKICTHIIYSFTGINSKGDVVMLDKDLDEPALKKLVNLKKNNPKLKILAAIGGWNQGSKDFSKVAASSALRLNFVENVFNFLTKHNLDGFDLDWEYPSKREGLPEDKENFIKLIKDLKRRFRDRYILTAAVGAMKELQKSAYNVREMSKHLDYINLMAYDIHSSADGKAGFNAPLLPQGKENNPDTNVRDIVNSWIKAGAKPNKLILGLGFYGKSYTLANAGNNKPHVKTTGPGEKGKFTEEAGNLSYMEICLNIKNNGWTSKWDSVQKVQYAFKGNQWVGYDNPKSLDLKVKFAKDKKLGGVMMWSIEQDDVHNACGEGSYPLLKAIGKAMTK